MGRTSHCTKKEYSSHANQAKLRVNQLFAKNVVDFLGSSARIVILDTAKAITSKTLVAAGIKKKLIHAPNLNLHDSLALYKYGVGAFCGTIETMVALTRFDAGWYDSMTNMNGRVNLKNYVGLFAHHFLQRNRNAYCVLAITINTECNQKSCNYLPQKEIFIRQINALIAYHGFTVVGDSIITPYKRSHIFGMWNLAPAGEPIPRLEFLKHRKQDRLIGFPLGFTEDHLQIIS